MSRVGEALLLGSRDLTVALGADEDVVDRTVASTARTVAAVVPGAAHVGAVLTARDDVDVRPTGDAVAGELDRLQVSLGEGPAVEAAARGETVEVDLVTDPRWPRLAGAAARYGVTSGLALVLRAHDGVLGVLTIYGAGALDPQARAFAEALAGQATVAIFGAQRIAGLARAVRSRDVIGQAKGILMQRDGLDDETAFTKLVEASQATNIKLVDVAHWLVAQARGTATDAPA